MAAYQNKKTGEVVSVQLFLSDLNDVHYDTDVLAAVGSPTALGFTIHVHQDNALVRRQGSNKFPVMGAVCIGDIIYIPK